MHLLMVPATADHAYNLMQDVRPEDNEEWVAATGSRTLPLLLRSIELGWEKAKTILDPGTMQVLTIHGVSPSGEDGVGIAWLIATKQAQRRVLSIHRHFTAGLREMHEGYPALVAWAYSRNTLHHQWMTHFGFEKTGRRIELGMGFNFIQFVHRETP